MKSKILIITAFVAMCFISVSASAAVGGAAEKIQKLEESKTPLPKLPSIKKGKLGNGVKYYILPDHEVPLVSVKLYLKGGHAYDPIDKIDVSGFMANFLSADGTESLTPTEVDKFVDQKAVQFGIGSSAEYISASLNCRSQDLQAALYLLLDKIFKPRFDVGRYNLIKKQLLGQLMRRPDDPPVLAAVGFDELFYGKDNAWGRPKTTESVKNISIDDIKSFQQKIANSKNMIIGISGDVSNSEALKILKGYNFKKPASDYEFVLKEIDPSAKKGIHIIDKDRSQAVFNIGHKGSVRTNPDKYALTVLNDILGGGGLTKRLIREVRVKHGLAYTVSSHFGFGPEQVPGFFKIYLETKVPSALNALKLIHEELVKVVDGDISEEEVSKSKETLLNNLIFRYASANGIISAIVHFNYFGYPDNYIEVYAKEIEKVTLNDVKSVAKKYLHPDNLQVVVAGPEATLKGIFNDYMKVNSLTIPK